MNGRNTHFAFCALCIVFTQEALRAQAKPLAQDYSIVFHNPSREFYVEGPGLARLDDGTPVSGSKGSALNLTVTNCHETFLAKPCKNVHKRTGQQCRRPTRPDGAEGIQRASRAGDDGRIHQRRHRQRPRMGRAMVELRWTGR